MMQMDALVFYKLLSASLEIRCLKYSKCTCTVCYLTMYIMIFATSYFMNLCSHFHIKKTKYAENVLAIVYCLYFITKIEKHKF